MKKTNLFLCLLFFFFMAAGASAQQYLMTSSDDKVYHLSGKAWLPVFHMRTLLSDGTIIKTNGSFAVYDYKKKDKIYYCAPAPEGKRLDALMSSGYVKQATPSSTSTFKGKDLTVNEVVKNDNLSHQPVRFHYLLVGVYDFEDSFWELLPNPQANVARMAEAIEQKMIPDNNYNLGNHQQLVAPIETTRDSILENFKTLSDSLSPLNNDLVMLYLSGHGVKDENGKFNFVVSDTRYDTITHTISNSIPADTLNAYVNKMTEKGASVMIFVDACYSGSLIVNIRNLSGSCVYFMSTENDLIASEDNSMGSPFARALVNCISGDEQQYFKDSNNKVTPQNLQDYLFKKVREENLRQRPTSSRYYYDMDQPLWTIKYTELSRVDELKKKAQEGDTYALVDLGDYYLERLDTAKANYYYNYAYEWKNPLAACRLGTQCFYAKPIPDYEKALLFFYESAEGGCNLGRYYLSVCFYKGLGTKKNKKKAKETYKKITSFDSEITKADDREFISGYIDFTGVRKLKRIDLDNGITVIKYMGTTGPVNSRIKKHPDKYIDQIILSAQSGYSDNQALLGRLYHFGIGRVGKDYKRAQYYYSSAAYNGNKDGLYGMGLLYTFGDGVVKDYQKAREYYQKAADKKHSTAYTQLGSIYFLGGYGIEKDERKGVELWKKAADLGDALGHYYYGLCLSEGKYVKKDLAKAFEHFKSSARKGNPDAQYKTGLCLYLGIGVDKDTAKAMKWLQKAKEQNNENAKSLINEGFFVDGTAKDYQEMVIDISNSQIIE